MVPKRRCISAFNEGKHESLGILRSVSNTNNIATTNSTILCLRIVPAFPTSYPSIANKIRIKLHRISIGSDSTKVSLFRATLNGVLSGSVTWTSIDSTSVVEYSTIETTYTGGREIHSLVVSAAGGRDYALFDDNIYLYPNDILILSGNVISGAASDLTAGISWSEEF